MSKLKDRLLVKNTLAYEPLLDLLVQFARDLHSEFYPYFKEVFPVLVDMCDCQDADLIQVRVTERTGISPKQVVIMVVVNFKKWPMHIKENV